MSDEASHLWLEQDYGDIAMRIRLRGVLHSQHSSFQHIEVFDSFAYGKLMRLANHIVVSDHDEALYSEGMVHPAMALHPNPKTALVLGGGDGGMARELGRYHHLERVVTVEIDQQVVDVSREFFPQMAVGLDDHRCELIIDDAHRYLEHSHDSFDIIIIDGADLYDPASDAVQAHSFAEILSQRLNPGGIVVCPLGSPQYHADSAQQSWRAMREYWHMPGLYQITVPSLAGGSWCIALGGIDGATTPQQYQHELRDEDLLFWQPELQTRLFTLPRHIRSLFI